MTISPKVAVCLPSGEDVNIEFMSSLIGLLVRSEVKPLIVTSQVSSRIAYNRTCLVDKALQTEATHILFIDTDMIFPDHALSRLLKFDKNIIGATASRRSDNDDAIGVTLDGERLRVPSYPVKMRWMGLPFMLIKREVFEKLKAPWFAEPPWWMMGKDDDGIVPEDEYFCIRAIEAGYDIYCDIELSMNIGHRGSKTFKIMRPDPEIEPKIDIELK